MDTFETGKRIQQLRKQHGWTQKDLAEKIQVSDKAVSKWERGLNYPDIALLEPLAQTLGTTVMELLGIADASESEKVENITALSVEETARLRKELRDRALTIALMGTVIFVSQLAMSWVLNAHGIFYGLPQVLSTGMTSFTGILIGNSLWIYWHHR